MNRRASALMFGSPLPSRGGARARDRQLPPAIRSFASHVSQPDPEPVKILEDLDVPGLEAEYERVVKGFAFKDQINDQDLQENDQQGVDHNQYNPDDAVARGYFPPPPREEPEQPSIPPGLRRLDLKSPTKTTDTAVRQSSPLRNVQNTSQVSSSPDPYANTVYSPPRRNLFFQDHQPKSGGNQLFGQSEQQGQIFGQPDPVQVVGQPDQDLDRFDQYQGDYAQKVSDRVQEGFNSQDNDYLYDSEIDESRVSDQPLAALVQLVRNLVGTKISKRVLQGGILAIAVAVVAIIIVPLLWLFIPKVWTLLAALAPSIWSLLTTLSSPFGQYKAPAIPPKDLSQLASRLVEVEKQVEAIAPLRLQQSEFQDQVWHKLGQVELDLAQAFDRFSKLSSQMVRLGRDYDGTEQDTKALKQTVAQVEATISLLQQSLVSQAQDISEAVQSMPDPNQLEVHLATIEGLKMAATALSDRVALLEQAESTEQVALRTLETILPDRLVVWRDAHDRVQAAPEFWKYLDQALSDKLGSQSLNDGDGDVMPSWPEFMALNQHILADFVDTRLEHKGLFNVVTKDVFLQALGGRLAELRADLTKELEGIRNSKSSTGHDEVALRALIRDALDGFELDSSIPQTRADLATINSGARIDRRITSPTVTTSTYKSVVLSILKPVLARMGIGSAQRPSSVERCLSETLELGECWPMNGTAGQVGLILGQPAVVGELAVVHSPQALKIHGANAPRNVCLWIRVDSPGDRTTVEQLVGHESNEDGYVRVVCGRYEVSPAHHHQQSLVVPYAVQQLGIKTQHLMVQVLDNWGNDLYTCLYKIRVFPSDYLSKNDGEFNLEGKQVQGIHDRVIDLGFRADEVF